MKTRILMAIAIAAVSNLAVWAQPKNAQPWSGKSPAEVKRVMRPDGFVSPMGLDEKQREEIKKIRMEQMKERTQTRNQLKEKRAKLEVLQTADKSDLKEINKVIDEIASIQAQEMKAQAAHRQKIRSMLTEEQRVYFDAHFANKDGARAFRQKEHQDRSDRSREQRNPRPQRGSTDKGKVQSNP